jgi:hypothetical protein
MRARVGQLGCCCAMRAVREGKLGPRAGFERLGQNEVVHSNELSFHFYFYFFLEAIIHVF